MSKSVSLSDKVAITSNIDVLRHHEDQIEKILNFRKNDSEVAKEIENYYLSNNIQVDSQIISKAVEDYYSDRLKFKEYKLSLFQSAFFKLWIKKKFILLLLSICICCFFSFSLLKDYAHSSFSGIAKNEQLLLLENVNAKYLELKNNYAYFKDRLNEVKLKHHLDESMPINDSLVFISSEELVIKEIESNQSFLSEANERLHKYSLLTDDEVDKLRHLKTIIEESISNRGEYASSVSYADDVLTLVDYFNGLKKDLDSLNLASNDHELINNMIDRELHSLKHSEFHGSENSSIFNYQNAASKIDKLIKYASSELIISLCNDENNMTGKFEGGRYYLYFSALKGSGDVVDYYSVSVNDFIPYAAVEVSKELYESVRRDKTYYGVFLNKNIGLKKKNSLSPEFSEGVIGTVGV